MALAADAERESTKLKKLEYFQNLVHDRDRDAAPGDAPTSFPAVVVDVRNFGLLVELPDFVLSGLIHVSELTNDFYTFDPVRLRFVGRRSKRTFTVGDRLHVEVANVDVFKRQVDFQLAEEAN